MKRKLKGLMGLLLSLALVMGLMPGMSVKATEPIAYEIYSLTLYKNDGTQTLKTHELSYNSGYQYELSASEFSREEYTLIGWSESADGDIKYNNKNNTFNTNTTLYAVWQKNGDCTITFNANKGTGEIKPVIKSGGENYVLPQSGFTRQGYILAGWAKSANGDIKYSAGQEITLRDDMNLYAFWKKTYTIKLHTDGGAGTADPVTVTVEAGEYTPPQTYPFHYLEGWAESPDGALKYNRGNTITIDHDIELYAVGGQSLIANIPVETNKRFACFNERTYRVLGADNTRLLLLLKHGRTENSTYQRAMDLCDEIYNDNSYFTDVDRAAVCSISKDNDVRYWKYEQANLENAHLFLLSPSEAETYFSGDTDRKKEDVKGWLRIPKSNIKKGFNAGIVSGSGALGDMKDINAHELFPVPAFVIDVLFESAIDNKYSAPVGGSSFSEFKDVSYMNGYSYTKLTLLDNGRNGFSANIGGTRITTVSSERNVNISYIGAVTGDNEYVSAMLCKSDGTILGYTSMQPSSSSGEWKLTLPSLEDGIYTLKVFSEQQNEVRHTDYASPMIPITLIAGNIQPTKENTPNATFTATGADSGILSGVSAGMKCSTNGGASWISITGESVTIFSGVTTTNGIKVYKPGNGTSTTDSDIQTIYVAKASAPTGLSKADCTTSSNNDGTITGITPAMEYRKSDATDWTAVTGTEITGLALGTYNVRIKATGTTLASDSVELTIAAYNETTPTGQVATPTFSPAGGSYTETQSVTISCSTVDADIYYTTNGTNPTSGSTKYTGPISVSSTTTIKAIAVKSGMTNSDIATAAYTINSGNGGNGGSGGENGGSGGNGGNGGGNGGGGGGVDPAPGPGPVTDPDPAPDPAPDPDPVDPIPSPENPAASLSVTDDPGAGKTAKEPPVTEKSINDDGSTTEKTFVENNDGSTTVTEKTTSKDNSTTISKTVVTESDKTVKTRETIEYKDGSKVETVRTQKEGYLIEKTVETTSDGKTREKSHSVITDEATKAVTETKTTIENDGSTTESSRTTQTNKDFKEVYVEKDKNQNLIEAKEISRVSDPATGRATETERIISGDGTSKELKIVKGSDNKPLFFSESQTGPDGEKTDSEYSGKKDGTLKLDSMSMVSAPVAMKASLKAADDELLGADSSSLIIPGTITGIEQETFIVSEIGNGAFKGLKLSSVTLPDTLTKVDENAFRDCGITELNISVKVSKGMFGKNALSGCGTGKKGKGLTINVQSKKYQKQMKKQLKKAGAGKAKVVIQK